MAILTDCRPPDRQARQRANDCRSLTVGLLVTLITMVSCQRPSPTESPQGQAVTLQDDALGPLVIAAAGDQFRWTFRFPGIDGRPGTEDDIAVSQHLHLPADREVRLEITSADYVYTFAIPELDLRQIAVPKLSYSLDICTDRIGTYKLRTDPMCGFRLYHDDVMGTVSIESPERFNEWLREQAGL